MAAASSVLLCAADRPAAEEVRRPLEGSGLTLALHPINGAAPPEPTGYNLILVDGSGEAEAALQCCQRLRGQLGENFVPILYLTGDASPMRIRCASLEAGADACMLRPFESGELLAQVRGLLRLKDRHDHLSAKTAEVHRINKRLQAAYQQIDQELELARRIQESFLPHALPELPQVRFAVHYQPCDRVGGDFYDVFRLDEAHFGFYVADAMGHGVPASLLTVFVKRGVRGKEISGRDYRLVPPGDVLQRLNRDLLDQRLSENPFITMVYVLFNFADGTLSFARSGHPHPLYLPREGPAELWPLEGSLLGVFESKYPTQTQRLKPGDKLLLYTDGTDAGSFGENALGLPSLLAAAEHHRALPIRELVDRLAHELFAHARPADDLTILGVEMTQN